MTPSSNGNCSCDCVNCGRSAICPTCDEDMKAIEESFKGMIGAVEKFKFSWCPPRPTPNYEAEIWDTISRKIPLK